MKPHSTFFETIHYYPQFLKDNYFEKLRNTLPWAQHNVIIAGIPVKQPRLISWHGYQGCIYTYSGLKLQPQPWTKELSTLKQKLEKFTNQNFNSTLANLYRDGKDSMGFHNDDEPELEPIIASLSFGATRTFVLKNKKTQETIKLPLNDGDLLIMKNVPKEILHGVPKTKIKVLERINLTFRHIKHEQQ